jgi:hypothetical protein
VKDEDGRLMNDFTGRVRPDEWRPPAGALRTLTLALDTAQYQLDMEAMAEHKSEDVYSSFNLLMRRKPKVWRRGSPWWCHCCCALEVMGSEAEVFPGPCLGSMHRAKILLCLGRAHA